MSRPGPRPVDARTGRTVLLELERVTIRFGGVVAISELDLAIREGEILGLIGPNGAGKTSTFNIVTGVYQASEGVVRFAGQVLGGRSPTRSPSSGWPAHSRTSASSRRCPRSRTSWLAPTPGTAPASQARFSACPVTAGKNDRGWSWPGSCSDFVGIRGVEQAGGAQPALRRPTPVGDCPGPCHRSEAAPTRRAGRGHEPGREAQPGPADPDHPRSRRSQSCSSNTTWAW